MQEPGELALGQHHALRELLERQADQLDDRRGHVVGRARQDLAARFEAGLGRARAALGPAHDAGGGVGVRAHREVEAHSSLDHALCDDGRDLALVGEAGHGAVQREHHRIEHRRLAATGGSTEREQIGIVELDDRRVAEGREPLDLEPAGSHWRSNPQN